MLYLRTCARIKLAATSSLTDENWDKVEAFGDRHDSSLRSVKKTMEICSNLLGIPDTVIGTTMRSAQLKEIDELYTTTVQGKDANLAFVSVSHVLEHSIDIGATDTSLSCCPAYW
jgi:hypothetical protein